MATAETEEGLLAEFLADPNNAALDLTTAVARCSKTLALHQSVVYLADLQQRRLIPLTDKARALDIDDSLAGWTYPPRCRRTDRRRP